VPNVITVLPATSTPPLSRVSSGQPYGLSRQQEIASLTLATHRQPARGPSEGVVISRSSGRTGEDGSPVMHAGWIPDQFQAHYL
jgi:hypothetical protein